ncbi:MAG: 50S ribosomal protein L31 [bacterium]|nr:50S ribosomal protein L31 [bacterium]
MKTDIHPTYHVDAKMTCACGNELTVGSTVSDIRVELCAKCHPFYTGKQKLIDSSRRVEKFEARKAAKEGLADVPGKRIKREKRAAVKSEKKAMVEGN